MQMDGEKDDRNSLLLGSMWLPHNTTRHRKSQSIVTVKDTFVIEWEESYLSLQSTRDSIVGEDDGTMIQEGGRARLESGLQSL